MKRSALIPILFLAALSCNRKGSNPSQNTMKLHHGKNEVYYKNHGERIAAFLFIPEDFKEGEKRSAIVINPPATGVKEQTTSVYAERLSKKGFITLAFDPRGFGESEGHPQLQNPYKIADDIKTSVSYLRALKEVDKDNIFSLGICAGSGFAAFATAFDSRIKALALVSPFLTTSEEYLKIFGGSAGLRQKLFPAAAAVEDSYHQKGEDKTDRIVPITEREIATARPIPLGMRDYYLAGKPGDVPNWKNELSLLSLGPTLSFSIYNFTNFFDSVPVYMVYGELAASAAGAQRFYDAIKGPKEKLVIKGARHFDLYWKPECVNPAVEGISRFLKNQVS